MKSSIHFEKATSHAIKHNFRDNKPSYLLPEEFRKENEYWKNPISERELFDKSAAMQKTGKKPIFENSRWEAVMNFNEHHNINDVMKAVKHIEQKFNITATAVAMHRDEGHISDEGEVIYNYHAHLNFITHKDGKQNWRKEFVKPVQLKELQTDIADIMQMIRGQVDSKAVRLDHRQYKAKVQGEELLKKEIAQLRAELKAQGAVRADYAQLEQLNKDLKLENANKDELISKYKAAVAVAKDAKTEELEMAREINQEIAPILEEAGLKQGSYSIKSIFDWLKNKYQELKNEVKELKEQNKQLNEENAKMYEENAEMYEENAEMYEEVAELKKQNNDLRAELTQKDAKNALFEQKSDTLDEQKTNDKSKLSKQR